MKTSTRKILSMLLAMVMIYAVMAHGVLAEDVSSLIKSVTPANGATGVTNVESIANIEAETLSASYVNLIKIEFNKEMKPSTLNSSSIVVTNVTKGTTISYAPVINDGTVYAIDPADLANIAVAPAAYKAGLLTSTAWADAAGNVYTITITTDAKLADGSQAVSENSELTSFTADYFSSIPYAAGKYIADISSKASEESSFAGTSRNPTDSLFTYTNADTTFVGMAMGNVTETTLRGTITLDKAYDIAGMMIRRRNGGGDYDIAYANYVVGDQNSNKALLSTCGGFKDVCGVVASHTDLDGAKANNGSVITLVQQANTNTSWHIPNRIWFYAYVDDPNYDGPIGSCIKAVTPNNGAENVTNVDNVAHTASDTSSKNYINLIKIEFSEEMNPATLNKDSIVIKNNTTGSVIDYEPIENNGFVYTIDPAVLANTDVNAAAKAQKNTGALWTDYINQNFVINILSTAQKADGTNVAFEKITSFTSDYFVDIPYMGGKRISNVATSASIETYDAGGNYSPQSLILTEPDMVYNNNGRYLVLNNSKKAKDVAKITLDKEYKVAGVMLRTRFKDSTSSWNYGLFTVGNDKESATAIFSTGWGVQNSRVVGNFVERADKAISGKNVYLAVTQDGVNLFFPNKIWIFAYVDDVENVEAVKSVSPSAGSLNVTNVGKDATKLIKIEFNEEMDTSTLNDDTVLVERVYTNGATGEVVRETLSYEPVINDGYTYAIDPADIATIGADIFEEYVHWNSCYDNAYNVVLKGNAVKKAGEEAYISDKDYSLTNFNTDYIVAIPYEEGKYIKNVAEDAHVIDGSYTMFGGYNEDADSMLTEDDSTANITSTQDAVAFNRSKEEEGAQVAAIDLGANYDIAGIMLRGRKNNSAYTSAGVHYYVDEPNVGAKRLIFTNAGIGYKATTETPFAVMTRFSNLKTARQHRGSKIYLNTFPDSAGGQKFHVVNKLWIFAYVNDEDYTGNTTSFDYRNFKAEGSLTDGFTASVEIDRDNAATIIAAVYDKDNNLVGAKLGTWDKDKMTLSVEVPANANAASMKVFFWDSLNNMKPQSVILTEKDLAN